MTKKNPAYAWWGDYPIAAGAAQRWRIGNLELGIEHQPAEWVIRYRYLETEPGDETTWETDTKPIEDDPEFKTQRHILDGDSEEIQLRPALADRPVVSRPRNTLIVHPDKEAVIYIGSPIWLQVHAAGQRLLELPIQRPSDTWFGANTRSGELCYATRTSARQILADLPPRPHRAITRLTVENRSHDALTLEKISLPVPVLSVYADPEGHLWTPALTLTRRHDEKDVAINIDTTPSAGDGVEVQLLTEPRNANIRGALVSAVEALFG